MGESILKKHFEPYFIVISVISITVLALICRHNFIIFHNLVELFSVVISAVIFIVTWNTRKFYSNNYFLFLGIAYLFVSFGLATHMITYGNTGMLEGVDERNISLQAWIWTTLMESVALIAAPFFIRRRFRPIHAFLAFGAFGGLFLTGVFFMRSIPDCFSQEAYTPFKVAAELLIVIMYAMAFLLIFGKREEFAHDVFSNLIHAFGSAIVASLMLSGIFGVNDGIHFIAHVLKILSFYFFYMAIISTTLSNPFETLFVDLRESRDSLIKNQAFLEEARLLAEASNRAKSDFVAGMSHELRTPLNSIIGFSEVLRDGLVGQLNEQQKEYVGYINSSGSHLLSLINDILDLSKVEAGKMELDVTRFPLEPALLGISQIFKEKVIKHSIRLTVEIALEVRTEIVADERKLKQIMYNLLSNAIKFTPDGGAVSVRARLLRADMSCGIHTDSLEINVSDTGIGIKQEDLERLFHAFSQIETTYDSKTEGTGLGLSLTKKLVELHGGSIWVESEPEKGSSFIFTIPLNLPIEAGDV